GAPGVVRRAPSAPRPFPRPGGGLAVVGGVRRTTGAARPHPWSPRRRDGEPGTARPAPLPDGPAGRGPAGGRRPPPRLRPLPATVPHPRRHPQHAGGGGPAAARLRQPRGPPLPARTRPRRRGGAGAPAMNPTHRVYVGTVGEGMFRSADGGHTFRRACEGMFVEGHVRALAVDPRDPATLYRGSEQGLFVSRDGADTWERLPAPLAGMQVWSLWLSPQRPRRVVVGTCPSRLFRSEDGGKTWAEADA